MTAATTKLIHRRRLLVGLGALFAAPAIVRATSLMPVKAIRLLTPAEIINQAIMELGTFGSTAMWIDYEFCRAEIVRITNVPAEWLK